LLQEKVNFIIFFKLNKRQKKEIYYCHTIQCAQCEDSKTEKDTSAGQLQSKKMINVIKYECMHAIMMGEASKVVEVWGGSVPLYSVDLPRV